MRAIDIIEKKRDGLILSKEEIEFFIKGYVQEEIQDYQASAFAMAIYLNGMTAEETTFLTLAMANSGEKLDLTGIVDIAVDKHSSGGVGDKTSIVVVPLVRACGLPVGKMSGRGLGFSGGTLDKLESIPDFRTNLTKEEFLNQLKTLGMVLSGQSVDMAPADGKLYALRDVTGTVQSIPLIASSIMSKKIAAGAQAIVLDIKVGNGAFVETLDEARKLAELMVSIGKLSGRDVVGILSDMNQPLGREVGNALEMKEAILTLKGQGPDDFVEHCLGIASQMLWLGKRASSPKDARRMAQEALDSGEGLKYLKLLVEAQNGDSTYVDHPEKLVKAPIEKVIEAPRSGYVHEVKARIVGETAVLLGAGRSKKDDVIDLAVGISVLVKAGDHVKKGQPLFIIHAHDEKSLGEGTMNLEQSVKIEDSKHDRLPLSYGLVTGSSS